MAVEDFTTYTETDPNSRITVISTRSTYTNLQRDEDAYVYKDKTASHFDGDFEHLVTVYLDASQVYAFTAVWALTKEVDDWYALYSGAKDFHDVDLYCVSGPVYQIFLNEMSGSLYQDSWNCSLDTPYYLKIKRDEAVGTYGTLYCYIYDDAERTNLVDTLTLTLHEKADFQYIFATMSRNQGQTYTQTGYTENLDLQEAAGISIPVVMRSYRNLRET